MLSLIPYKIKAFFERLKQPKISKFPLVKFDFDKCPEDLHHYYESLRGRTFILLGDIKQQMGHCILIDINTKEFELFWHTEDFIELTDDEV